MASPPTYSYNPQKLLASFRGLKAKEEEALCALPPDEPTSPESRRPGGGDDAVVVATVQFSAAGLEREDSGVEGFWRMARDAVEEAATEHGARLVLIPELFLGPYFCQSQEACLMGLALEDAESSFVVRRMQELAKKHAVMVPVSLFERHRNALYNTVVMIDADGSILGKYRKSHIPDGTGYQEKFYFTPGDTGFRVFRSGVVAGLAVGVGICWDQWFPEAARAMALQGADVLLYPTAIGSEPQDPTINSADHWQRVMQGHSAANVSPRSPLARSFGIHRVACAVLVLTPLRLLLLLLLYLLLSCVLLWHTTHHCSLFPTDGEGRWYPW